MNRRRRGTLVSPQRYAGFGKQNVCVSELPMILREAAAHHWGGSTPSSQSKYTLYKKYLVRRVRADQSGSELEI